MIRNAIAASKGALNLRTIKAASIHVLDCLPTVMPDGKTGYVEPCLEVNLGGLVYPIWYLPLTPSVSVCTSPHSSATRLHRNYASGRMMHEVTPTIMCHGLLILRYKCSPWSHMSPSTRQCWIVEKARLGYPKLQYFPSEKTTIS